MAKCIHCRITLQIITTISNDISKLRRNYSPSLKEKIFLLWHLNNWYFKLIMSFQCWNTTYLRKLVIDMRESIYADLQTFWITISNITYLSMSCNIATFNINLSLNLSIWLLWYTFICNFIFWIKLFWRFQRLINLN